MRLRFSVFTDLPNSRLRSRISALASERPSLRFDDKAEAVFSESEEDSMWFAAAAEDLGCSCTVELDTVYEESDLRDAAFGVFQGVEHREDRFRAVLPKDAFSFEKACPQCGLGAAQQRPHVLSPQSLKCKPRCYGTENSPSVILPAAIARDLIEATGQPECMRFAQVKSGDTTREWMEPVPLATMPPLSKEKSIGILFGDNCSEDEEEMSSCPKCGRECWAFDGSAPPRLVYHLEEVAELQSMAVTVMHEPWSEFPIFDHKSWKYKDLTYCLPYLLFNNDALKVLIEHARSEIRSGALQIIPVYIE